MTDGGEGRPGPESAVPRDIESPYEVSPERAGHWVAFYTELIDFETRILRVMRDGSRNLPQGETSMARLSDIEPLERLIAEFTRRRDLWAHAAAE